LFRMIDGLFAGAGCEDENFQWDWICETSGTLTSE
jgi:hypothetical protein